MEETARPQSEKPLGGSPFARSVLDWTETIVMAVVLVAVLLAPATAPRPAGEPEPRELAEDTAR